MSMNIVGLHSPLSRRGAALIIVLWVSLGLASIAIYFSNSMVFEYRATANTVEGYEAVHAIDGALQYVKVLLRDNEEKGLLPLLENYESNGVLVGDSRFWLIGRGNEYDSSNEPLFSLGDEASRLNLNTITYEMLMKFPDMTADFAGAIIDWRDEDEEVSENGAESETYLRENPGYNCKNGPFETVEELRLVRGATDEILYGEDTNRNGVLDPWENDGDETPPADDSDGQLDPGIIEYLTVYNREANLDADGEKRLDVSNVQTSQQIRTMLEEELGGQRAQEIASAAGLGNRQFTSMLEFYIRSQMTIDEFDTVSDKLSVWDGDYIEGMVNVNSAPAAVLACIPGLDENMAAQLVSYRQGQEESLYSVAWVADLLEEEAAFAAGPYLTAYTYQVVADVVAVGENGRGLRRQCFIIDTSGDEPIVLFRQDRSRLGWPLGAEVRQELISGDVNKGRFQ